MKKGFLVLMVVVLAVGSAFAQVPEFKLSAGAGGYFTSDFGGGTKFTNTINNKTIETIFPYAGGGGFVFFDATFAELSLGFFAGSGEVEMRASGGIGEKWDTSRTGLDISLLGKYPFTLGEHFTLFPLLGIDYRHIISLKNKTTGTKMDNPGDYSALWFKFGVGTDYAFTDHIFVRLGILYGLRLANKYEKDQLNVLKSHSAYTNEDTLLGHGLDVKLAVGYKF
jgi:opacity protein-like surface antigen